MGALGSLTLTSVRVFGGKVPESVETPVAPGSSHVGLAMALSGDHVLLLV